MRNEDVVETNVRIRGRQGQAGIVWMLQLERIDITGIEHGLDGAPAYAAATEPDQRLQTEREFAGVELFSGCHRIEVAGEHVKALTVPIDALEQLAQLEHTPPLRPCGVNGAQVHAEHTQLVTGGHDLQERVP